MENLTTLSAGLSDSLDVRLEVDTGGRVESSLAVASVMGLAVNLVTNLHTSSFTSVFSLLDIKLLSLLVITDVEVPLGALVVLLLAWLSSVFRI